MKAENCHDEDAADAVAWRQLQLRLDLVLSELGFVARIDNSTEPTRKRTWWNDMNWVFCSRVT